MTKKEDFSSFFVWGLKNNTNEKELWYNIVM